MAGLLSIPIQQRKQRGTENPFPITANSHSPMLPMVPQTISKDKRSSFCLLVFSLVDQEVRQSPVQPGSQTEPSLQSARKARDNEETTCSPTHHLPGGRMNGSELRTHGCKEKTQRTDWPSSSLGPQTPCPGHTCHARGHKLHPSASEPP